MNVFRLSGVLALIVSFSLGLFASDAPSADAPVPAAPGRSLEEITRELSPEMACTTELAAIGAHHDEVSKETEQQGAEIAQAILNSFTANPDMRTVEAQKALNDLNESFLNVGAPVQSELLEKNKVEFALSDFGQQFSGVMSRFSNQIRDMLPTKDLSTMDKVVRVGSKLPWVGDWFVSADAYAARYKSGLTSIGEIMTNLQTIFGTLLEYCDSIKKVIPQYEARSIALKQRAVLVTVVISKLESMRDRLPESQAAVKKNITEVHLVQLKKILEALTVLYDSNLTSHLESLEEVQMGWDRVRDGQIKAKVAREALTRLFGKAVFSHQMDIVQAATDGLQATINEMEMMDAKQQKKMSDQKIKNDKEGYMDLKVAADVNKILDGIAVDQAKAAAELPKILDARLKTIQGMVSNKERRLAQQQKEREIRETVEATAGLNGVLDMEKP